MIPREDVAPRATQNLSEAVAHFAVCFLRVVRNLQLYPAEHRHVRDSFEELAGHVHALLGIRKCVTIGFRDDAVIFEDQVLLRGHPTVAALRRCLEEKNVESFTVDREVPLAEMQALASALARPRKEVLEDGRLPERLLRQIRSIRLNEVHYRRIDEDERPEPSPPPVAINPFLHLAADDPERADGLTAMIATSPEAMSAALLDMLRRTIAGVEDPEADVRRPFLRLVEILSLALLDEPGTDLSVARVHLDALLRPLSRALRNEGLRRLLREEIDHDVLGVLGRFSLSGRARILLTEARAHAGDVEWMRSTLGHLVRPEESLEILETARTLLRRAALSAEETRPLAGLLDRLVRERAGPVDRGLAVLADADPTSAEVTRVLLERAGMEVLPCADGAAALEAVQRTRPALLVLDPVLPVVHGLEVLARLKRLRPVVPVLLLSDHEGFRADYAVSTYPSLVFLGKGCEPDALLAALDELVAAVGPPGHPLGPESVFESVPAEGPTVGMLRTNILDVGLCARGRFRDTFFRILPYDAHRAGILVLEHEASPDGAESPFRDVGLALDRSMEESRPPINLLRDVDQVLRRPPFSGILLSGLSLLIDGEKGTLSVTRAGSSAPIVATPGGAPAELHLPFGPLLGASHGGDVARKLQEVHLTFPAGATILLHSSGALAAVGREDPDLGARLFTGFLREHAGASPAATMEALIGLLNGLGVRGPGGDLQVLLVRRREPPRREPPPRP